MRGAVPLLCGCALLLSGCAVFAEAGLVEAAEASSLAARAAGAAGADAAVMARGAALSSEAAGTMSGGSSFFIDGAVRIPRVGNLGEALAEVAARKAPLLLHDGIVRVGTREIASLDGANLFSEGKLVGRLQDGLLIDEASGTAMGRLRGFIPRQGGELQLLDRAHTGIIRSLAVDILGYRGGQGYLVRLASGQEAVYAGDLTLVALTAAVLADQCDDRQVDGFAVRYSGEVMPFNSCEEEGGTMTFGSANELVVADRREIKGLIYVSERESPAQTAVVRQAASFHQDDSDFPNAQPTRASAPIRMEYEAQ